MWHLFADVDGNTIGLGSVSVALVTALGYMLRDRRDSDKRVDLAKEQVVATVVAERDRAIAGEAAAYKSRDEALEARDEANKQLGIIGYRLQVTEAQLRALKGEQ